MQTTQPRGSCEAVAIADGLGLAFYLIGQAKTGISSPQLSRHLGVKYDTVWLLHTQILRAMSEREQANVLREKVQLDDTYLGG